MKGATGFPSPGYQVDHSPPSGVYVKNEWNNKPIRLDMPLWRDHAQLYLYLKSDGK